MVEINFQHQPVLLEPVIDGLLIKPEGYYIDATFGCGGHSQQILRRLGPTGRLLALDRDPAALSRAQQNEVFADARFSFQYAPFSQLWAIANEYGWVGKVAGIIMDCGVSSPQLDDSARGFSFMRDGPLDMRMDSERGLSAATWLNQASEKEISDVLWQYGEEKSSRALAKAIVIARQQQPLLTTQQLVEVILKVKPIRHPQKKHPATHSFQAIRIFINDELTELKQALAQSLAVLNTGGRLIVISFHSLEDRIVKQFIHKHSTPDFPAKLPIQEHQIKKCDLRKIGQLVRPGEEEIKLNPRARSARLRIAEKII